ncbi:MAG: AtpZ/AtpI family protein [Actinomycetota bacterium]|nr:AtpZ/AtpI family protein [Actinomycetota bacterium]
MEGNGPDRSTLLGIGATVAGALVVGLALGVFADNAMDSTPVFTLCGLALGIVGASAYMYSQFKRFLKE